MKHLQTLTLIFMAAVSGLFLTNCDTDVLSSGIDFTDAGSAEEIKKTLVELTKDHSDLIEIRFNTAYSADQFSDKMAGVTIIKKEGEERVSLNSNDLKSDLEESTRMPLIGRGKTADPIDLASLDYSAISKYIADGKEYIPEGYTYKGLGPYALIAEEGYVMHEFSLEVTKDGENSALDDEITYYEVSFETDADGNLVFLD